MSLADLIKKRATSTATANSANDERRSMLHHGGDATDISW
jgi:hypothetical protein